MVIANIRPVAGKLYPVVLTWYFSSFVLFFLLFFFHSLSPSRPLLPSADRSSAAATAAAATAGAHEGNVAALRVVASRHG